MTDAELAHTKELAFWMTERVFMNPISAKLLNEDWRKAFPDEVAVAERMKALVEALEKAQQVDEELCRLLPPGAEYMDPPDGGDVEPIEQVRRMVADYRQRIAELESRTVKLPKPKNSDQGWKIDPEFINKVQDAIGYDDTCECWEGTPSMELVEAVLLAAAGIKVEAE
ncbi:hypothetical protein ACW7C8_01990 [Klebsiella pneumoniae]|uniref:hypothetical protein n=1 Tax=Gammaproteobacteria TaxID=1236 RepID=UPI0006514EBF|nr:hypothetical protein [Klebsiella pneumoniae]MCX3880014.1 hypothetical protein [Stenotrophomonas maltophilia]MCC5735157.1 hypothetical protein [Klebsiella pneumoniae]MCD4585780.1 hypothetical protein [Klebsiella pneumoniae]MCD5734787.1 hypothetical protein [Klebsiella pneumoniae]MCD8652682.1 hypothetical protein [Klebsiella pneumoniae]